MTPAERAAELREGDLVPEFVGATASGRAISRTDLLGRPSVLFFYPKAGSVGCSIESREFARLHDKFSEAGVTVVGVSVDPPEAQKRFQQSCDLPFDLLADQDRTVSRRFGVLGRLGLARRTTFVIGADGRVVKVLRTWRPTVHAQTALEAATKAARTPAGPPPPAEHNKT